MLGSNVKDCFAATLQVSNGPILQQGYQHGDWTQNHILHRHHCLTKPLQEDFNGSVNTSFAIVLNLVHNQQQINMGVIKKIPPQDPIWGSAQQSTC